MKNKLLKTVLIMMLIVVIAFASMLTACQQTNDNTKPDDTKPPVQNNDPEYTIKVTADKDTVVKNDIVTLTVEVEPQEDYTIVCDQPELVNIVDNKVAFIGDTFVDKYVRLSAVLNKDATVRDTVVIRYNAPVIEGQVGELTSDMIAEIGNESITVTGTITDYYQDFNNFMNNRETTYNMAVYMQENRWSGVWSYQQNPENEIRNDYMRGEDTVVGLKGEEGHALLEIYVNKDNVVSTKVVKNYESKASIWESQHLWNHLKNLDVTSFTYDLDLDLYCHELDVKNNDDLYLMTYLSYCLTPVLEDTLDKIYLKVEGGKIVGMSGQTEILYVGASSKEDGATAMSYTTIDLTFSNIGTTVVADPKVYDAPEYVEKLEAAIKNMQSAKNYYYQSVDTTTYAPDPEDADASLDSVGGEYKTMQTSVYNSTWATGTVGQCGWVTEDGILFARTGKYTSSMDNRNYHTEYSGYKNNDDGTYDFFEFYSEKDGDKVTKIGFKGTKKTYGTFDDVLPKFNFSANIFEYIGQTTKNGVIQYRFALKSSAITRDVAMQLSMDSYADSASAAVETRLIITVDDNGNLVSTVFPYNLSHGVYLGHITTTYSHFGDTKLPDGLYDDYIPRVWGETWDKYICKYYTLDPNVEHSHEVNAQIAFNAVFDSDTVLPAPTLFLEIFGDNFSGPFFDYTKVGVDENGNDIYKYDIELTARWLQDLDENWRITDWEAVKDKIIEVMSKAGFKKDNANTKELSYARYVTMINEETGVQVVFENNGTRNFWIHFYVLGGWHIKD